MLQLLEDLKNNVEVIHLNSNQGPHFILRNKEFYDSLSCNTRPRTDDTNHLANRIRFLNLCDKNQFRCVSEMEISLMGNQLSEQNTRPPSADKCILQQNVVYMNDFAVTYYKSFLYLTFRSWSIYRVPTSHWHRRICGFNGGQGLNH